MSSPSWPFSVDASVTLRTKGHQILLDITPQVASQLDVMDLQGVHSAAILTPPAVSLEDLAAEPAVLLRLKP